MKALLLEDDYLLNKSIHKILTLKKFEVNSFLDGEEAYKNINDNYSIFIIDINVPNIDGISILEKIKEFGINTPVIIISADIDINTISRAYTSGCDEYLKKPFHIKELEIKIDRLLSMLETSIEIGGFKYDKLNKILYKNDSIIDLSQKELLFLDLLLSNINITISKEQIESYVWNLEEVNDEAIRSLIRRIRAKTTKDLIENIKGVGYRISK